jgi:hypothetical protein
VTGLRSLPHRQRSLLKGLGRAAAPSPPRPLTKGPADEHRRSNWIASRATSIRASPQPCVVLPRKEADLPAAARAVADLLAALGKDRTSEHLCDTPRRVAHSYAELLTSREFDLTTFPNDEGYDELVLAKSIYVHSLCEHHCCPSTGSPTVVTCPVSASSGCRSSPASSTCSLGTYKYRSA